MPKITLQIGDDEQIALEELARQEISSIEQAAANAVHRELERRGFLKTMTVTEGKTQKVYQVFDE